MSFPCTTFELSGFSLYLVVGAAGPGTGTWNADTGAMELDLPLLASLATGAACPVSPAPPGDPSYLATLNLPISLTAATATDTDSYAPALAPLTGVPLDLGTGEVTLVGIFSIPASGSFVDGVVGLPGSGSATLRARIAPPENITGSGLPPNIPTLSRLDTEYIRGPLISDLRYYPLDGFLGVLGAGYDVPFYTGRYCLDATFQEVGFDLQCRKRWSGGGTLLAETDNGLDGDGVPDCNDNCPYATQLCSGGFCSNGSPCTVHTDCQTDSDGDLRGDACDPCTDTDGDGADNDSEAAAGCSPTDARVFPLVPALYLGGGANDELLTFNSPAVKLTTPAGPTAEVVINVHPAVDPSTFAATLNTRTNVVTNLFAPITPGCAKRVTVPLDTARRTNRIKLEIRRFPDPGKPKGKRDRDRLIFRQ